MADCVESSECCDGQVETCCKADPQQMEALFNEIDKDGDHLISKEELNELLTRLGHKDLCQEKVSKVFGEVDEDKDDKINFEQFQNFLPTATEL